MLVSLIPSSAFAADDTNVPVAVEEAQDTEDTILAPETVAEPDSDVTEAPEQGDDTNTEGGTNNADQGSDDADQTDDPASDNDTTETPGSGDTTAPAQTGEDTTGTESGKEDNTGVETPADKPAEEPADKPADDQSDKPVQNTTDPVVPDTGDTDDPEVLVDIVPTSEDDWYATAKFVADSNAPASQWEESGTSAQALAASIFFMEVHFFNNSAQPQSKTFVLTGDNLDTVEFDKLKLDQPEVLLFTNNGVDYFGSLTKTTDPATGKTTALNVTIRSTGNAAGSSSL